MKRFLLLLIPVILMFAGCDETTENNGDSQISASLHDISIPTVSARQQQLDIVSNGNWSVSVNPETADSWITVSPSSGRSGTTRVTISVLENESEKERSAEVVFSMSDGTNDKTKIKQSDITALLIEADKNEHTIDWKGKDIEIKISYNVEYTIDIVPESAETWIKQTGQIISDGLDKYIFSVLLQDKPDDREASIVFSSLDGTETETVSIAQTGRVVSGSYSDGDYIPLQRATVGSGIDIVIMGDGYTEDDINVDEIYERDMKKAMENFFSVYPYDAYREYFNVWMVVGVSKQSGTSIGTNKKDTAFGTWITGNGSDIKLSKEDKVTNYAKSIPGITQNEGRLTVLLIINSTRYAGTCIMYSNGYSISMCPQQEGGSQNSNARAVVMHECGGHGFGQLGDEYVYGGTMSSAEQYEIKQWQKDGAFLNIDFTADRDEVLWKDFFNYPKYTNSFVGYPIGIFEGAMGFAQGIYRPERTSCMDYNIDYFNAPSRYKIISRIMALSGVNPRLSMEEFVELDTPRAPTYNTPVLMENEHNRLGKPILRR